MLERVAGRELIPIRSAKETRQVLTMISDLSRALRCCQQEAVFCEDVTFSQFFILDRVAEEGSLKLADLHGILGVDKSTTTRFVNPLVQRGLLKRQRDDEDSRAVRLTLTSAGSEVHRKVWDCFTGFLEALETGIPLEKRGEVFEAIQLFMDAMRQACTATQCGG